MSSIVAGRSQCSRSTGWKRHCAILIPEPAYTADSNFSGDQTQKDKGIDLKARLWQESRWVPQISASVRDFLAQLFDSEYLTASKRVGPFDFTLGMG